MEVAGTTPYGVFNHTEQHTASLNASTLPLTTLRQPDEMAAGANVYQTMSHVLLHHISPAICIFGILGNVMTLLILTRRTLQKSMQSMERSSNSGLVALSASDILFCITVIPKAFLQATKINSNVNFSLVYTVYGDAIINIFITSSTLLTVTMAMQRYLAICYPIRARLVIDFKRTRIIILCVFLTSVLLNLPRFWKYKIVSVTCLEDYFRGKCSHDNMYLYIRRNSYMKARSNENAKNVFMVVHFILSVAIPLILLTFCNTNLIKALKNSKALRQNHSNQSLRTYRKKEPKCVESTHRITLTFVVIIILFVILVTPAEITNFVREFKHTVRSHNFYMYKFIIDFVNTLQKLNFAFNFVLYCVINVHFRKTLWNILTCRMFTDNVGMSEVNSRRSTLRTVVKCNSMDLQLTGQQNCEANENQTQGTTSHPDDMSTSPETQHLVPSTQQHYA